MINPDVLLDDIDATLNHIGYAHEAISMAQSLLDWVNEGGSLPQKLASRGFTREGVQACLVNIISSLSEELNSDKARNHD